MDRTTVRAFGAIAALAAVWIGVYWLYDPTPRSLSFAEPTDNTAPSRPAPNDPPVGPAPIDPTPGTSHESPAPSTEAAPLLPPDQPAVIPPEFREHVVRDKETFATIAARYYGRRDLASVIAAANPLKSPTRLKPGDVLRIPVDPNNVQGLPTVDAPARPMTLEYVVVKGDSLSKISQRFYGTDRHADQIYAANRDVLRSKDDIRVGETLRIPTPESIQGAAGGE